MQLRHPEELNGILLGERSLQGAFGDPIVKIVALGGITPTDNMKAFLKLPLKFRTYPKVQEEDMAVQTEGRAARQWWILWDKKAQKGPENF